jgi:KAP-like P-loop domain-containing protein
VETVSAQPRESEYSKFRILVDDPAEDPALGFPEYADAFAEIVADSPPRFAVGIFGSWGSGKTTLMRAIWKRVADREDVIPVWFNAWRYEREEHLIIPLLDVLREALVEWAEERERKADAKPTVIGRARRAAAAMGSAARAIATGLSFSARLPGGFAEAKLELDKVLTNTADATDADDPVSLYHASFVTMRDAVDGFITAGARRRGGRPELPPQRRIVVFIDDLDRCLPLNALAVLESMKLFFDLEGFVFVAGLDQQVIERAIELRYADPRDRPAESSSNGTTEDRKGGQTSASSAPVISGRDYIKKIFQVPFGLPPVDRSELNDLVSRLVTDPGLDASQKTELTGRILGHLNFFSDETGVNPREVKRLINAYTLQAKLMSLKLKKRGWNEQVDLDTILAIQVIAFRPDWERIWRRLEANPAGFVSRFNEGLEKSKSANGDTVWVDGEPVPPRLVSYLEDGPGQPLRENLELKLYLSSSQASHSSDPLILQAQARVDDLIRYVRDVDENTDRAGLSASLHEQLGLLQSTISMATAWGMELKPLVLRLETDASEVAGGPDRKEVPLREWTNGFRARLDRLASELDELRDRHSLSSA